jgi:hypothetical protein
VSVPQLHPAIGGAKGNRYCGPGALAILTGLDTGACAAAIRGVTGKPAVRGVRVGDLLDTAWRLRLRLQRLHSDDVTGTLGRWAARQRDGRYLVHVTGHYVVVRVCAGTVEVCDNLSVYPQPLTQFRRSRVRVRRAWRVL